MQVQNTGALQYASKRSLQQVKSQEAAQWNYQLSQVAIWLWKHLQS